MIEITKGKLYAVSGGEWKAARVDNGRMLSRKPIWRRCEDQELGERPLSARRRQTARLHTRPKRTANATAAKAISPKKAAGE
jgi:hypothetical protein